jgi:prepilin-type N-terminal cleavage/methylation domain-containing protein
MERKKMKKKGFTLVELLVVIAIIAMLLAILMPALGKVRQLAQRIMCGTNIGGVGKAMLTYSTDDPYESYPIAGGGTALRDFSTDPKCSWDWSCKAPPGTTGGCPTGNPFTATPPKCTVSANLYLLVKYADVSPDQFICAAGDEKKFEMVNFTTEETSTNFTDLWDFGAKASIRTGKDYGRGNCSYSYQCPLPLNNTSGSPGANRWPVYSTSNPGVAVLADRSIYWSNDDSDKKRKSLYAWMPSPDCKLNHDSDPNGNAPPHQKEGQNVLFADQHVKFEKSANCGVEMDNIYTTWANAMNDSGFPTVPCDKAKRLQLGLRVPTQADNADNYPQDAVDSYLVHDWN